MEKKTFEPIYPVDPWCIREERFSPFMVPQGESIFSVGNGYLGLRGNLDEGSPVYQNGTYINGFYEYRPLTYGENIFGMPQQSQTMINLTDAKIIKITVDGETFDINNANIKKYLRCLDMRTGTLTREILWETSQGKEVSIKSTRLASFHRHTLAAIAYEVALLNGDADIVISTFLVSNESNQLNEWDPREVAPIYGQVLVPIENCCDGETLYSAHETNNSKMKLACLAGHTLDTPCHSFFNGHSTDTEGKIEYHIEAKAHHPITLHKFAAYHTAKGGTWKSLHSEAEKVIEEAMQDGFYLIETEQKEYMDHFWQQCDIEVEGDDTVQQGLRLSLFHIIQSVGKNGERGMAAKGLTGQGYEGHYFWDTEIYVLPLLTYTMPHIAANLLKFRHGMIDKARERARVMNERGVLFPWRTINGEEASAYFPAGTAQFHINADIMYALKKYVDITGDMHILEEFGAEMLIETARFWVGFGCFSDSRGGKFCINGVTGPDEYTAIVDNNVYTNMMARENLMFAYETLTRHPERCASAIAKTSLSPDEPQLWRRAAEAMYIPYDEEKALFPQDDTFFEKEMWPFDQIPEENYPLLLHYHPLCLYRHQVLKQSDLLLAMLLLSRYFTKDQIKRNFDYYDPLTTGDSSLSDCIQGIIGVSVGYHDRIYEYFMETVEMDLENVNKNVGDGVHIASMAGAWLYVVYGFAGMRDDDAVVSFDPKIPSHWSKVHFKLKIRDCILSIRMTPESTTYGLVEGETLTLRHRGETLTLTSGTEATKDNEALQLR